MPEKPSVCKVNENFLKFARFFFTSPQFCPLWLPSSYCIFILPLDFSFFFLEWKREGEMDTRGFSRIWFS